MKLFFQMEHTLHIFLIIGLTSKVNSHKIPHQKIKTTYPNPRFLRTLGPPNIPQKSSRKNRGYCYVVIRAPCCRIAPNIKEPQILRVNICGDWDQKYLDRIK